jgi:hypothetical protein
VQFAGRFTEEMMVVGRVGVEIRAPRLDDGLAQQLGELVQRIVNGRQGHRDPRDHGFPVQLFGSDEHRLGFVAGYLSLAIPAVASSSVSNYYIDNYSRFGYRSETI